MQPRENKNVTQIKILKPAQREELIFAKPPAHFYQQAWDKYKASGEYMRAVKAMSDKGMKQPYINNILELAFMAGRNSK